jgi:hypothetical protein
MIRPFFPKERKRVFIKILDEFADQLKVAVDQFLGEHYPGVVSGGEMMDQNDFSITSGTCRSTWQTRSSRSCS